MRILSSHHVALTTRDLARLRAFYGDTLGLPLVGRFADHRIDFFDAGGVAIEIEEVDPAAPAAGSPGAPVALNSRGKAQCSGPRVPREHEDLRLPPR